MVGEHNILKDLLGPNGWELVEARKLDHRWYLEMWLIKSIRSPTDCFIFFTFETDPQMDEPTGRLPAYKITATLRKPVDWMAESDSQFDGNELFEDSTDLFLGRTVEKKIPAFFKDLANLRQKFYNFYQ